MVSGMVANTPVRDDISLELVGDRAVFKGTTPRARELALEMNREVSEKLTTSINAGASISKASPEEMFEEMRAVLWPERYEEQEEATPQTNAEDVVGTIPDSVKEQIPDEDGTYTVWDTNGNSVTVTRDGNSLTVGQ